MKNLSSSVVLILAVILVAAMLLPLSSLPGEAMASEAAAETEAAPTPEHWAFSKIFWAALTIAFSVMGTSWAQSRIGVAGAGAMAEKPELAGTIIILIAIPETMVILGFVIATMILVMT